MCQLFQYYRCLALRFRILQITSANTNPYLTHYVGFQKSTQSTQYPTTNGVVMDAEWVSRPVTSTCSGSAAADLQWRLVPADPPTNSVPKRSLLKANVKWWNSRPHADVDDEFDFQGMLFFGCASTDGSLKPSITQIWEVDYTFEFTAFVNTTITPPDARVPFIELQQRAKTAQKVSLENDVEAKIVSDCLDNDLIAMMTGLDPRETQEDSDGESQAQSWADACEAEEKLKDIRISSASNEKPVRGSYVVGFKKQFKDSAKQLALQKKISIREAVRLLLAGDV